LAPSKSKLKALTRSTVAQAPSNHFSSIFKLCQKTLFHKFKVLAIWSKSVTRNYSGVARSVGAFVIAAPPYFVNQYYQLDKFATVVRNDWPLVAALLDHHIVVGILLAGIWAFFMLATYRLASKLAQEQPNGWIDAPIILLQALDNVVGAKEQRFSKFLNTYRTQTNSTTSLTIFNSITQPNLQLNELILGIYKTIDLLLRTQVTGKYILKVNLATIKPSQEVNAILFHYPSNHPVRSSLEALNAPNSAIKTSIRTRKIVVLESIQIESARAKPKFVVTDQSRADEDGSLICFPVFYESMSAVVFVISIHIDRAGTFSPKFASSYDELLKPFALRMKLEYALLALKELTKDE